MRNTWYSVWRGEEYEDSGTIWIPDTHEELFEVTVRERFRRLMLEHNIGKGDEVVIERFQYRPGTGANSIEFCNALIAVLGMAAKETGANVVLLQASTHKQAYRKHHTEKFPCGVIDRVGSSHAPYKVVGRKEVDGVSLPILERKGQCQHVIDAMTVGFYRILKRNGKV